MIDIDPKNIIVRMPNWVGDLIMATPILSDLKKRYPRAKITAMVKEPISELLKTDEAINELFVFKKQKHSFTKLSFTKHGENKSIIENLREEKYDLGILLTNSFSSSWFFYQGHVKNSIGYKKDLRSFLLKHPIPWPNTKLHQVIKYKMLLKPLSIEVSDTKPRLFLNKEEISNAMSLLYQRGYEKNKTLIGINPLARYGQAKCWPAERFKEVAKRLSQDEKNVIVFIGDESSKDLIAYICQDLPKGVINLAGRTSLRELACIIHECDLFLTNDSGPMHIASAFETPLVALFGSTSEILSGPYNEKDIVINKKVECSPCNKRVCPIDFKCMTNISIEEVIEKLNKLEKNAEKNC